jgi:hypothetical protein
MDVVFQLNGTFMQNNGDVSAERNASISNPPFPSAVASSEKE